LFDNKVTFALWVDPSVISLQVQVCSHCIS